MVPSDRTLATFYKLSVVTMSPFAVHGLSAIFNGNVQAISGRISEMVRDMAKTTINH